MKKQITFRIDAELIEKIKDLVCERNEWSLNSFVEYALTQIIERCEPIAPRTRELRTGRKIQ